MSHGLGKGLEGLFEENLIDEETTEKSNYLNVRISNVEPNKKQPRKVFNTDSIDELTSSISEHGVLQPLVVRTISDGRYQIISGERRWRAARQAGLLEIPVIVKDEVDDKTALELGLIENLQREDLNAVEEAKGYKALSEEFNLTQEQVAARVGKSRSVITNSLRILSLPDEILQFVLEGKLTSGHARALLSLTDKVADTEKLIEIAKNIIRKNLSVREVENMSKQIRSLNKKKDNNSETIYYKDLSGGLSSSWGRKIKINPQDSKGRTKGTIVMEYYDKDDFNNLVECLQNYSQEGNNK